LRVLVDTTHPAEVNFLAPLIRRLKERGDTVLVTAQYKPGARELLAALDIEHVRIGGTYPTPVGVGVAAIVRTARMLAIAAKFRPQIMLARLGVIIGVVGRVLRVPAVSFDENDYAAAQLMLSRLLSTVICTGMGYEKSLGRVQRRVNALFHFTYTHPSRFAPDAEELKAGGLGPEEPYVVLRLSAWQALHDIGYHGLSDEQVVDLIEGLEQHARVIVTSEREMSPLLRPYANPLPMDKGLHLLAFAELYIGEGASMAAEAACLGTPAIWVSPLRWGFINLLKEYGLVEQTTDLREVKNLALRWLADPAMRERAKRGRQRLLEDSEDPLDLMLQLVDECALRT
jgi:predicted glycosyltransferase